MAKLTALRQCAFSPRQGAVTPGRRSTSTANTAEQCRPCGDDGNDAEKPPRSAFTIEVRFLGGLTQSQEATFAQAAARWSEIIVGDLQAVQLPTGETVDDLLIDASGVAIDGVDGVLGRAGPQYIRNNGIPAKGIMEFDTADLARMEADGSLANVIIHEMGHVIGLGTIWSELDLLVGCSTANPIFLGEAAKREFGQLIAGGSAPVPVANTGGPGTRCGHWRESIFGHELMTGFLNAGSNPISRMTIASFEDMGYEVNYDAADDYTLPTALQLAMMGIHADGHKQRCYMCGGGARPLDPVMLPNEAHL